MRHYINLRRYAELFVEGRVGLRGHFAVELIHARTGLIKRRLEFPNLIVNAGFAEMMSGANTISRLSTIAVGTGNAEPAVTDTNLQSQLHWTTANGGFGDDSGLAPAPGHVIWREFTRVFTEAEANGNLTEVGVKYGNDATLWCRQLFRDELGNPTAIPKTNEDQLKIIYRLELVLLLDDQEYDVNVATPRDPGGVVTGVVTRPSNLSGSQATRMLTDSNASLGDWAGAADAYDTSELNNIEAKPSGSRASSSSRTVQSYVPGALYRDMEYIWNASAANWPGGVGSVFCATRNLIAGFQSSFTPKLDKTEDDKLVIMHRFSFARL